MFIDETNKLFTNMIKVIIASQNQVKVRAAKEGFAKVFPQTEFVFEGIKTDSGVSNQPRDSKETFRGAFNRANAANLFAPEADFWVGQESGVELFQGELSAFTWVVIKSKAGIYGKAKTCTFFLPTQVSALVQQGKDLGEADNIVFGRSNSNEVNGAIGLLTSDLITRTSYIIDATILALIPFKSPDLYK